MLKRILFIILIATVGLLNAVPVLAATTAIVSILGIPAYSGGILSFNVIYTSDTEMDLNWTLNPSTAQNIMIRAKYGQYPADIPDENTMPSDGYLVYYGDGLTTTSAVDTSMDFSENAGSLYYKAWAQKVDGTWYVTTGTGNEESRDVILATLFGVLALGAIVFTASGLHETSAYTGVVWVGVLPDDGRVRRQPDHQPVGRLV